MNNYCFWIVMLTSSYTSLILGKLVRKGYKVGAISADYLVLGSKDCPSHMMGIRLETSKAKSMEDVFADVVSVIDNVKAKHFGIVATNGDSAKWVGSNISLSEIQKSKTKKSLRKPSYLTLIKTPTDPQPNKDEVPS